MSWPSEQRFGPWEQHGVFAHIMGHDEPLDLSRQKRLHLQYDKYGALDLSLKANGHDGDKQDQPSLDAVITQNTTPHESPEYLRPSSVTSTKMANNVPVGMTMHQSRLHTFLAKLCCRHQSLLLQILRSNVPSHCSGVVQTPADLQNHSGASQLPSYSLPWIRAEANFESYRHSPPENRASHNGHATFEYIQPALFPRSCSYQPIPNISYRDGKKWPGGGRTDALGSRPDTKGIMEDCCFADGCVRGQRNTMHPLDNLILRENASLMVKQEHNAQEPLSTPSVAVLSRSTESSSISVQGISNSMASSTPTSWNKSNRSTQPTSYGFTSQHLGHPQEFNKGKQPAAVLSRSDGSVVDLQGFNGNKLGKSFEEVQAFPKMTSKVVDNQKITNFLQQVVSYQNCKQDLVLATPRSVWDSWLDNGGIPMTIPVEKGSYLTGEQAGGEYWRHDVLLNKNMKVNCCLNENKTLYKLGGDCLDNSKCSGPATIVNESQGAGFDDLNCSATDNKLVTNGASSTPSGPASDLTGQQDIVYVGHSGNQEQNGSRTVASTPITFSPQRHSARKSTRGHLYSENHYELQTLWLTAHSRKLSEMASDMTLPLAQSLLDSHNLTTDMHDGVAGISCDAEITNHNGSHKFDQLTSNKQLLQVSEIQNITESVNKVKLQQKTSGDQACENVMEFNKCKESLEDSTKVLEENDDSQRKKDYKGKVQRKRKKGQKLVVALESLCRFRKREKLDGRVKAQGEEAYSRSILHLPDNGDQIMLTSVCNGNEEKEDSTPAQSNFHKIKHEDNPAPLMSVTKSHMIETMPPVVDLAPSDEVLSLSTVKDDMSTCSKENGPYKRCISEKKLSKRKREFAMPMQNSTSDGMVLRKRHGFRFSSSEKTSNGTYCDVKVLNASNFMHENSHKISTPPSSVTDDDEGDEMQDNPEEMHNQMKSTAKCDTPWPLISRPDLNIVVWNHNTETVNREVYTSEHKSVCVPYVEGLNDNMEDVTAEENDERLKNTSSLSGSVTRCRRHLRTTRGKMNGYCRGKTSLGFLISVDAETLKQRTVIASAELLISAPFGDFDFSSDEELEETTWKRPRRRKYKKRLLVNNSKNTGAKKRGRKPRVCREILSIPSRDCADDIFFGYTRKTNGLQNTRGMGLNENECFDALTQNLMPFDDSAKNFKNEGTYSENESRLADLLLYGISDNDLALINSKFEQANRLWVPLQKVACPLLKPTRVKGRRRVEEDQPESNLKTSYIRHLFSSGLNLPDICKWFKEPTEDTKRKRVKVDDDDDERPTSFVKPEDKRTTETNKNCTSVVDPIESCIRQGKCSQMQFPSFMPSKSNSGGLTTKEPKQPFCGIEQTSHLQSKQETYHNSSSLQGTCIC